jgi:Na+/phosphate symporter
MKADLKDLCKTLHDMANDAEESVSLLQTSFIYFSLTPLNDCRRKMEELKKSEPALTRELAELARGNPDVKPYLSVPVHLVRIGESMEKLADCVEKMVREQILFSDRAIEEITFLLQRLMELLRPTADIILARNAILAKYVTESRAGVVRRALEYSTLHEERLIEGVCIPFASSLYIRMLDEIKNIAWHAKEIAEKLTAGVAAEVRT